MKTYHILLITVLLMAISACVTTKVDLTHPSKSYQHTKHVQLLIKKPARPYKVIAIIKGKGSTYRKQSLVIKKIEKKARKIGAQAIIPVNSDLTYFPPNNSNFKPIYPIGPAIGQRHFNEPGGYKFDLKVKAIRFSDVDNKEK